MPDPVLPPVQGPFRAIAVTVVPEAERLSARGWEELERLVEHRLAAQPAKTRRQIRLFVRVLRRGVWGLRVLVQLGYYTQSHVAAEIGYLADPLGWEARR